MRHREKTSGSGRARGKSHSGFTADGQIARQPKSALEAGSDLRDRQE
jgi:hypothetical protein